MLKKISRLLLLGIVVCAGSAYVTPTYASSAILLPSPITGVMITHIYAGTPQGATHELVVIFNNTDQPVDITGWCLANKVGKSIYCFVSQPRATHWIESGSSIVVASEDYAANSQAIPVDAIYTVSNKSSGSIVGSSDAILLLDAIGRTVDERAWSSTAQKGNGLIRNMFDIDEGRYAVDSALVERLIVAVAGGGLRLEEVVLDDEPLPDDDSTSTDLKLTEALPNPVGADTGAEFIEIFNPSQAVVSLKDYRLAITAGVSHKEYPFPQGVVIAPGEYAAFSDKDMKYALNNSAGSVTLITVGGENQVIDTLAYSAPKEGMAWAWFGEPLGMGEWQYTDAPTPGSENIRTASQLSAVVESSQQKPCATDQYRHPDTGRCRKNQAATPPVACKTAQYRSAETGRCRNIASVKAPVPCKAGQERSVETGRCRNIKKMTVAGHAPALKVEEQQGAVAWYTWLAVAVVVLGVGAYGAWEWRRELAAVWQRFRRILG